MIIDEKGKLFGKISIIDIAVVLILILAIVGGVVIYNKTGSGKVSPTDNSLVTNTDSLDDLCIEFQLSDVRDITKNAVAKKDKIYSDSTGDYIGEVIRIDSKPFRNSITGTDGTIIFADVPEKYELTIYVKTTGQHTDTGYYLFQNTHLAVGESFAIKTETIKTTPIIKKVYEFTDEIADKFKDKEDAAKTEEQEDDKENADEASEKPAETN